MPLEKNWEGKLREMRHNVLLSGAYYIRETAETGPQNVYSRSQAVSAVSRNPMHRIIPRYVLFLAFPPFFEGQFEGDAPGMNRLVGRASRGGGIPLVLWWLEAGASLQRSGCTVGPRVLRV
jgi:hypothetical protein